MSRKFRWTFEATFPHGKIEPTVVQVNSRLIIKEDNPPDPPSNYLVSEGWKIDKPGEIVLTFFDAHVKDMTSLYQVFAYDPEVQDTDSLEFKEAFEKKLGIGKLVIFLPSCPKCHQCGAPQLGMGYGGPLEPLEEWTLEGLSPYSINFGELNYTSDPTVNLEITWRYKRAIYKYLGHPVVAKPQGPPGEPLVTPPTAGNGGLSLGTLGYHCQCDCPNPETHSTLPQD